MRPEEHIAVASEEKTSLAEGSASEILDHLIERFGDKVMKLAYYYMRDRYLAEDIFQEVFCRVYLSLSRFRKDSSYFTWIYRITVNLCRDYKTSAYFRRMLPRYNMEAGTADSAETRLLEEAEAGEVFARVMELPQKCRVVVAMYYFEELKTPEIAARLGIKETTVRARLSRGREMLKALLKKEDTARGNK